MSQESGTSEGSSRVVSLADRRRSRDADEPARSAKSPAKRPSGDPIAFGVELPPRPDLVMSVAALTQLITVSDMAGLEASPDLLRAIESLRRRLRAHDVGLPPALEETIRQLTGDAPAQVVPFEA